MKTKFGLAVAVFVSSVFAQQPPSGAAGAPAAAFRESSMEARFQLDLKVPDEVIKPYLPEGFTSSVATQGPAKDCNVRLIFTDRVTVNGADGKPVGKGNARVVFFAAPVKDASGANAQLILGGLVDDESGAPGPFGNYLAASTHEMKRTSSTTNTGAVVDTQDWLFEAKSGEHLEMHITYERGAANRSARAQDAKYYSAKTPGYVEVSHQEQMLEILRNTTTNPPDKVKSFSLKIGGGSFEKFAPAAAKPLSWDNIVWLSRQISMP
ncbi:MAG TPA: hypothetical protein VN519_14125 [Bryobacteraceae bacterium]|nr:hypothetical protein [Bryobacteraceae bacterium]